MVQIQVPPRQTRIGSLDSGSVKPILTGTQSLPGGKQVRSTSVDLAKHEHNLMLSGKGHPGSVRNPNAAWKQLNDDLNHLFPMTSARSRPPGMTHLKSPNRELRKSSSRSSLLNIETDLESEDDQLYHHTVTGVEGARNKSATGSRNLPSAGDFHAKIHRSSRDPEDYLPLENLPNLSNASSMHSLYEPHLDLHNSHATSSSKAMLTNGVRREHTCVMFSCLLLLQSSDGRPDTYAELLQQPAKPQLLQTMLQYLKKLTHFRCYDIYNHLSHIFDTNTASITFLHLYYSGAHGCMYIII